MSAVMPNDGVMDSDLVTMIFGDAVDPRELIAKMSPDQSEVHVNRPLSGAAKKQKRKSKSDKSQKAIALATNAVGVVGGPAAIYAAAKSPALRRKAGKTFRANPDNAGPILKPIQRTFKPTSRAGKLVRSPKALAAGAAGATLLQVGNMTGDAISVKYFAPKRKKKEEKLSKKLAMNNLKPMQNSGDQLKQVNNMFAPLKNTGLTPLAAKPIPSIKPLGSLNPKPGLNKPKSGGPKPPKMAKPMAPITPNAGVSKYDVTWETEISKVDKEKKQIFGWATVTHVDGKEVVDKQDDYIPLEEIEKAAYEYVVHSRVGGDQHARDGHGPKHTADLIESMIFSPEKVSKMGLDPETFPKMGWWLGMKVNDEEQWQLVKDGKRTGLSIHGSGTRISKEI